jgi:AcrR family transcriptional regulator
MDRIAQPRNQRSRDTREDILDAAWQLLEEEGGTALTMRSLATAAGISRSGLYLHIGSRGQLFDELLDHIDRRLDLTAALRPVQEAADATAALRAWAHYVATYHQRLVAVVRAVDRGRHDDPDAQALWQRATDGWYGLCRSLADALARERRLDEHWSPQAAADLLWALMSVEFIDDLRTDRGWSTDELVECLQLLATRTLCPFAGRRTP